MANNFILFYYLDCIATYDVDIFSENGDTAEETSILLDKMVIQAARLLTLFRVDF
jgi:hypothetical protein